MPQESLNLPYLVLIGVVSLTIIVSFLVYKDQVQQWQTKKAEIVKVSTQLQERQNFLQSIDQKSAQLRANAGAEQELSVLLPTDESFDDVLRIIDRQGAAAAVFVQKVENTTPSTQSAIRISQALGDTNDIPDTLTVHGVTMNVQGSYQQIRQFMSLMENAVRFMDISGLNLTQVKDRGDIVDGVLTANFYSLSSQK